MQAGRKSIASAASSACSFGRVIKSGVVRIPMKIIVASLILPWAISSPAFGRLVVTSYQTVVSTNGFAPTSQTQYIALQTLANITPAHAEVSGDWTGPNADGTPDTWHFVGTSRATSTTTITPDSYTAEAAAAFAYEINTTPDFVDPRSASVFTPGGAANYNGFFTTDVPLVYVITARLNQRGRVRLNQIGGPEIFDENNLTVIPRLLNLTGVLPPGQYQFLATTSLSAANLPNGVNHYARSGSFENLVFEVRVPEPSLFGLILAVVLGTLPARRRKSRTR
jgi:hypothetical protein